MKLTFRALVILLVFIYGCSQPTVRPTISPFPTLVTASVKNTLRPLPTNTIPASTPIPTINTVTATGTPTGSPLGFDVILSIPGNIVGPKYMVYLYAAKDGSFWIVSGRGDGFLYKFENGKRVKDVSLAGKVAILTDFALTESRIWILGREPSDYYKQMLLHFDIEGNFKEDYEIPKAILKDRHGNYQLDRILVLPGDEIVLTGSGGSYLFFDKNGKVNPKLLEEYNINGHTYRIVRDELGRALKTGTVIVDGKPINIPSQKEHIYLDIIGFAPDGSFYIYAYEFNGSGSGTSLIYYYDSGGNLLGWSSILGDNGYPVLLGDYLIGPDDGLYTYYQVKTTRQVIRLRFINEPFPSTPTSASPGSLTPTLMPLPTLGAYEARAYVQTLFENNGGCSLPCWWGITPGQTSISVFYLEKGILLVYNDNGGSYDIDRIIVCPQKARYPFLYVWSPGLQLTLQEASDWFFR